MVSKIPIVAERIRKVPSHFSWIDHRLVRDRHLENCSHAAATLYLFLVTVGDAKGLSYYGDQSISKHLCMDQSALEAARANLINIGLIAWQKPLYQVLSLDSALREKKAPRSNMDNALSLGDILKIARGGTS
ncbi:MAG: hypothetical protein KJP06_04610 [Deltaproteobacteria bacterium]|nr:hypothetical protein [Deltaproteobacteria bacterium]